MGEGSAERNRLPNALVQLQAQYNHCGEAASEKCLSAATFVRLRAHRVSHLGGLRRRTCPAASRTFRQRPRSMKQRRGLNLLLERNRQGLTKEVCGRAPVFGQQKRATVARHAGAER